MSLARTAALSLALLGFALPALAQDAGDAALVEILVESASTPAQHGALAKYYRGRAADERKLAAEHKAMGNAYGGTKLAIARAGKEHCAKLEALHESAAGEYDKLAAEHESLAKK